MLPKMPDVGTMSPGDKQKLMVILNEVLWILNANDSGKLTYHYQLVDAMFMATLGGGRCYPSEAKAFILSVTGASS